MNARPQKRAVERAVRRAQKAIDGHLPGDQILTVMLDMRQQIGGLVAKVDTVLTEQAAADRSRARIHERLDDFGRELGETKRQAALTAQTVNEIAPLVDQHEQKRQRAIGKRQLIANQKTAIVGFATGGAWLAAKLSPVGAWLPDWLARILFIRS